MRDTLRKSFQTPLASMVACITLVACSAAGTSRFPKCLMPGPQIHIGMKSKADQNESQEANSLGQY